MQSDSYILIYWLLPVSKISGRFSQRAFTTILILHENIHATRVAIVSAEELGTMSENSLRGITIGTRLM